MPQLVNVPVKAAAVEARESTSVSAAGRDHEQDESVDEVKQEEVATLSAGSGSEGKDSTNAAKNNDKEDREESENATGIDIDSASLSLNPSSSPSADVEASKPIICSSNSNSQHYLLRWAVEKSGNKSGDISVAEPSAKSNEKKDKDISSSTSIHKKVLDQTMTSQARETDDGGTAKADMSNSSENGIEMISVGKMAQNEKELSDQTMTSQTKESDGEGTEKVRMDNKNDLEAGSGSSENNEAEVSKVSNKCGPDEQNKTLAVGSGIDQSNNPEARENNVQLISEGNNAKITDDGQAKVITSEIVDISQELEEDVTRNLENTTSPKTESKDTTDAKPGESSVDGEMKAGDEQHEMLAIGSEQSNEPEAGENNAQPVNEEKNATFADEDKLFDEINNGLVNEGLLPRVTNEIKDKSQEEDGTGKLENTIRPKAGSNDAKDEMPGESSANRKRKAEVEATGSSVKMSKNASSKSTSQQELRRVRILSGGNFVKVILRLPPLPQKLGLIIKNDEQHDGLPVLMTIKLDSPFLGLIPMDLLRKYFIVMIKDDEFGETKITCGRAFEREIKKRRKEHEETIIEITLVSRGSPLEEEVHAPATQLPVGMQTAARLPASFQIPPHQMVLQNNSQAAMMHPHLMQQQLMMQQVAQHQQQMAQQQQMHWQMQQQQIGYQEQMQQQQQINYPKKVHPLEKQQHQGHQEQIQPPAKQQQAPLASERKAEQLSTTNAKETQKKEKPLLVPKKKPSADGNQTQEKKEPPSKSHLGRGSIPRALLIRRALIEFFREGETRDLETFCRFYSRNFAAINREVFTNPALCELQNSRKPGEGFSKKVAEHALWNINSIFSSNYASKKLKKGEQQPLPPPDQMKKPNLPPIVPRGHCKGMQSKVLDEFCADKDNDKTYLYESTTLSNFQGWRHKDCLFIAEIDNNNQCHKCKNAVKNFTKRYLPNLLKKQRNAGKPQPIEKTLLPKWREMRKQVCKRLEEIDQESAQNDPQLVLAAKLMKLKGDSLELNLQNTFYGNKSLFLLCDDCGTHMLKTKAKNRASACNRCTNRRDLDKRAQKLKEKNKGRLDTSSTMALKYCTREEVEERYKNLKFLNKKLERLNAALEKKCAKEEADSLERASIGTMQPAAQPTGKTRQNSCAPLLPWPFYLNYNADAAQDYSMPTNQAPKSSSKSRARPVLKSNVEARVIFKSPENKATKKITKDLAEETISGSDGKSDAKGNSEEIVTEEIADESLDYASIGSAANESVISTQNDSDDNEDDDGNEEEDRSEDRMEIDDANADNNSNNESNIDFDGHLV